MCGFLQGDSCSPVGFCFSEVPLCKLLQETKGNQMGQPGKREAKQAHSLFIEELKVYLESRKILKDLNKTIVQTSHDTGVFNGVANVNKLYLKEQKC